MVPPLPLPLCGPWPGHSPSVPQFPHLSNGDHQPYFLEPCENQRGSHPRDGRRIWPSVKPSVHGNVYCYSGNMGLSTQVPTASGRQCQLPWTGRGWQQPAPRPDQGPRPFPMVGTPNWVSWAQERGKGNLCRARRTLWAWERRKGGGGRDTGREQAGWPPLTFVDQQLLQGLAPLECFL